MAYLFASLSVAGDPVHHYKSSGATIMLLVQVI